MKGWRFPPKMELTSPRKPLHNVRAAASWSWKGAPEPNTLPAQSVMAFILSKGSLICLTNSRIHSCVDKAFASVQC